MFLVQSSQNPLPLLPKDVTSYMGYPLEPKSLYSNKTNLSLSKSIKHTVDEPLVSYNSWAFL